MGVNSLPKTVARQRRDCDLNPDPPAPESSTLTTRLPSHLHVIIWNNQLITILLQQWSSTQKQVLGSFENVRKIFASRVCGTRPPGPLWVHHWIQRTVREDSIGSGPVSSGRWRSSPAWPARHLSISPHRTDAACCYTCLTFRGLCVCLALSPGLYVVHVIIETRISWLIRLSVCIFIYCVCVISVC